MSIKNNLQRIKEELEKQGCRLIAVSKTHPVEKIKEAYDAGQLIFGENKVQEMLSKYEQLPQDIAWHLIGHLQRNKVKFIAPFISLIHSVDSLKLLEEINKQAEKNNRVINCLLQVHIATEENKFGFSYEELRELIHSRAISHLKHVHVIGLMGMATFTKHEEIIRSEFKSLKALFEEIKAINTSENITMKELSMGMSSDYKIALEEGSTFVRIGTAIFGERDYQQTSAQ
jgi:PLP dependent protein